MKALFPLSVLPLFLLLFGCRSNVTAPPQAAAANAPCRSCSHYNDFSIGTTGLVMRPEGGTTWVIRDMDDWEAYCDVIYPLAYPYTTSHPAVPVDLAEKMLIAKAVARKSHEVLVPRDVCIGPWSIRVTYELNETCPSYRTLDSVQTLMYAVPNSDLPVFWEETVIPYTGPPCSTPTVIFVY